MTELIDPGKTILDYGFPDVRLQLAFSPWHALLLALVERETGTIIGGKGGGAGYFKVRDDADFDKVLSDAADEYNAKFFRPLDFSRASYTTVDSRLDKVCRRYAKENTMTENDGKPTNWASLQEILDDEVGANAIPANFTPKLLTPQFIAQFCRERYRVLTRLRYAELRGGGHDDVYAERDNVYGGEWKPSEAEAQADMYFAAPVEEYGFNVGSAAIIQRREAVGGYEYAAQESNVIKSLTLDTSDLAGVEYHLYLHLYAPSGTTFHAFGNNFAEGWNHRVVANGATFWRVGIGDVRNAPTDYDVNGYSDTRVQQDGEAIYADLQSRFRFCPVK